MGLGLHLVHLRNAILGEVELILISLPSLVVNCLTHESGIRDGGGGGVESERRDLRGQ